MGDITPDDSDTRMVFPNNEMPAPVIPPNMLSSRPHVLITEDNLINQTVLNSRVPDT